MSDKRIFVAHDTLAAVGEGQWTNQKGNKLGYEVVMDFYTQMAIEGRCFQVRAGTITTPAVGDIVITDTAADMSADCLTGVTIIPVFLNVSLNLAANTLVEVAGKSVTGNSTVGAAFVPLPLKSDGPAATSTARVAETGAAAVGVTVPAEAATTTIRHFSWGSPIGAGAWDTWYDWEPVAPPILTGPRCFYFQIAAGATAGPSYYASFDYIELPSINLA